MLRVSNIKVKLNELENPKDEIQVLKHKLLLKLKILERELKHFKISKKSVDARKKDDICLVYSVDADVHNETVLLRRADAKNITPVQDMEYKIEPHGSEK